MFGMSVALVQFNPVVGDPHKNAKRMIEFIQRAVGLSARTILFGELALTGYCAQDLHFNRQWLDEGMRSAEQLREAAKLLGVTIAFGMARPNDEEASKGAWNAFVCINPDGSEWVQNKVLLPTYGEFDENRWFQPGEIKDVRPHKLDVYSAGVLICEDGWNNEHGVSEHHYRLYDKDPVGHMMGKSSPPNVLINISASPDYIGKQQLRLDMNARIAKHYKVPLIMLNVVGAQDELVFGGRSFVMNNRGELLHEMLMGEEDMYILRPATLLAAVSERVNVRPEMQELDHLLKIYLCDYIKKSGNDRAPLYVGLSGGKDSTLVATVLARHLGPERVHGVLMPYRLGQYTAPLSIELAESLGDALGIHLQTIPIDQHVDALKDVLGLSEKSLSHQNLQARIRANILWGLANKTGGLVMNTTNFSEAATGYGTIGGDLLGLPLIASLPATTVIRYLRWLKEDGNETALTRGMIERAPSAELAPSQTDEDELGSYEFIDPILESIRMHHGDLRAVITQFSTDINVGNKAEMFFDRLTFLAKKLLVQSEFKRWYYFKTPQLTPFTWLRWKWPIANSDFDVDRFIEEARKDAGF